MPQEELDLLQLASRSMAEPSTGPSQIVWRQLRHADALGGFLHNVPNRLHRHAISPGPSNFVDSAEQFSSINSSRGEPIVEFGSHGRVFLSVVDDRVLAKERGPAPRSANCRQAFRDHQLVFHGNLTLLAQPRTFAAGLRPLFRKDWVVYAKPPFGGPEYVLQYWGRYTHRVAISNHRLVSFAEGKVAFRWRDSAHHNEQKLLTLSRDEFLRRFLLHVLPKGFVRIRNFGFLANRRRATLLPLCFHVLGSAAQAEQDISGSKASSDLWLCPKCGAPMMVIERLTAAEIQLRSPPALVTVAA